MRLVWYLHRAKALRARIPDADKAGHEDAFEHQGEVYLYMWLLYSTPETETTSCRTMWSPVPEERRGRSVEAKEEEESQGNRKRQGQKQSHKMVREGE